MAFGIKRKEKKAKKQKVKKSFLESGWLSALLVVVIVFVIAMVIAIPRCQDLAKELEKYKKLSEEIMQPISQQELINSQDVLDAEDVATFKTKFNGFLKNKKDKPIFDENSNFLKNNMRAEDLVFIQNNVLLNKEDIGCCFNSSLGAGWILEFFDDTSKQCFLKVVGFKEFFTETNGKINFCLVAALELKQMLEADEQMAAFEKYIQIPDEIYFTFSGVFDEDHIYERNLQVNKLSKESNTLFLDMFLNLFKFKADNVAEKINEFVSNFREGLKTICQNRGISYEFVGQYLVLEKQN